MDSPNRKTSIPAIYPPVLPERSAAYRVPADTPGDRRAQPDWDIHAGKPRRRGGVKEFFYGVFAEVGQPELGELRDTRGW